MAMSCPNCERVRKEMDEIKESMQLREFELEEKLNHLEDKVEWAKEDETNLKAELADTRKELERYKALVEKLGHGEQLDEKSEESDAIAGTSVSSQLKKASVPRLLEIIKVQTDLLREMKDLIVANVQVAP